LIHLALGLLMLYPCRIRSDSECEANDGMRINLTRVKQTWTDGGARGWSFAVVESDQSVEFDVLASMFVFPSFVAHTGVCVYLRVLKRNKVDGEKRLTWWLTKSVAWWRWLEYAVTAPVMFACLLLLIGLRDELLLLALFFLMATTMFFGFMSNAWRSRAHVGATRPRPTSLQSTPSEQQTLTWDARAPNSEKSSTDVKCLRFAWIAFAMGLVPYVVSWFCYLYFFHRGVDEQVASTDYTADEDAPRMPDWVYGMLYSTIATFSLFAVLELLAIADACYGWGCFAGVQLEYAYCLLSVVSKLTLALFLIFNVLRYTRYSDGMSR
jgi:hypothetical protein